MKRVSSRRHWQCLETVSVVTTENEAETSHSHLMGRTGEDSTPAYSLCVKHCAFRCVPVVCMHPVHLSYVCVMSDAMLAYACLCVFMCMDVLVCTYAGAPAQGHQRTTSAVVP